MTASQGDEPPAVCLKAIGACPPEDVGGIHMWNDIAAALRADPDPSHLSGDLEMYAAWLPDDVDPDDADVDGINLELSTVGRPPEEVFAAFGMSLGDAERVEEESLHPAYASVIERATPDLVVDLAVLYAAATAPADTPDPGDLDDVLRPWRVLLELAHPDGIPLTRAGWMTPAACERLWHDGGLDWGYGKGNREQHTPELHFVREIARRSGLIRKYKDRLVLTKAGRSAVGDREALADALGAGLLGGRDEADVDERVLTVLLLASGYALGVEPGPWDFGSRDAFLDEVAPAHPAGLASGPRSSASPESPPGPRDPARAHRSCPSRRRLDLAGTGRTKPGEEGPHAVDRPERPVVQGGCRRGKLRLRRCRGAEARSPHHLGVEVDSTEAVEAEQARLADHGLATLDERATTCCYATQDKFWVEGTPNGEQWEVYTVLADSETFAGDPSDQSGCRGAEV